MTRSAKRQKSPTSPAAAPKGEDSPKAVPSPGSDGSVGEPVRTKLKETRIDATSSEVQCTTDAHTNDVAGAINAADYEMSGSDSERGRLPRKRSFDDVDGGYEEQESTEQPERHARKKSRDAIHSVSHTNGPTKANSDVESKTQDPEASAGPVNKVMVEEENEVPTPKNKRTRAAYLEDQSESIGPTESNKSEESTKSGDHAHSTVMEGENPSEERNPKRPREKIEEATPVDDGGSSKAQPYSGLSNASTASPFASLSPRPSAGDTSHSANSIKPAAQLPQTSSDKFKASGFSAFASSASPLGGFGQASGKSPFAAPASGSKPTLSSFASPIGSTSEGTAPSAFGSLKSSSLGGSTKSAFGGGFGDGASGFGSLGGTKTVLSSFASPGASQITGLSSKPLQPFGAKTQADENEEEDEEDSDSESVTAPDQTTDALSNDKSSRFQEQEIETGEEGEEVVWTGRAKLYHFHNQWKEGGIGQLKLNVTKTSPKKARFVLRADGTHRLLLNSAIQKSVNYGGALQGGPENGFFYIFVQKEDGTGLQKALLKMKNANADSLYEHIMHLKEEL